MIYLFLSEVYMTNDYLIQFPKDDLKDVIQKIYPQCTIESIKDSIISRKNKAVVADIIDKSKATYGRLHIYFSDFDCDFSFNHFFKDDQKVFDNLRLSYLEKMVKFFAGTNYIQKLEEYYSDKINIGYSILQDKERTDKELVKKAMKQVADEIKYLKILAQNHTLEQ